MSFIEPAPPPPEEYVTLVFKRSTRNVLIAKLIILAGLSLLGGYFFARQGALQYEKGRALTEEQYLAEFDEYRGTLLSAQRYDNPVLATLVMLLVMSFMIGSYELVAFVIGFLMGKVLKP